VPRERLHEIARQLAGIGGGRPLGFGPNRVRSLPDGVAQALLEYIENTDAERAEYIQINESDNGHHPAVSLGFANPEQATSFRIGDLCPECGQAAVVNEEGCRKCYACGFSEC
jgi:ribonucleoside-diphosphate reductase alpha chain